MIKLNEKYLQEGKELLNKKDIFFLAHTPFRGKDENSGIIHSDIKVFLHHIYEYEKGLRNLVLYTSNISHRAFIEKKLEERKIAYLIQNVTKNKINVFFGHFMCIEVLKNFGEKGLNEFSHEEDFILGIMLGYDKLQQCERYIKRKGQNFLSHN